MAEILRTVGLTRRDFLRGSVVVVGIVAAAGGSIYGAQKERGEHLSPGELPPELEEKLVDAGYYIYVPGSETVANMRAAGLAISPLTLPEGQTLTLPEGQPHFETVPSKRKWIAIKPDEFLLSGKGNEDVKGLVSLVRNRQTVLQGQFGKETLFVPGEVVDLVGLDLAHQLDRGVGLFNGEGFVMTGTRIKINGKDSGIGVGRRAPGEPISYTIFDASTQAPTPPPDKLQAVGVVVSSVKIL